MNKSHEGFRQFVVASRNAAEFFDSTKEPLHFLPHSIFHFVVGKQSLPVCFWRNHGFNALMFQEFADVVAVVGFVHHGGVQPARFWRFSPNIGEGSCIMALPSAQAKRNGDSLISAGGMQFGGPSAAGSSSVYGMGNLPRVSCVIVLTASDAAAVMRGG